MKELYRFRQFLTEGDFKNPILDKYLKLKKSIDYKTVFPTDLQSFVDSLDNTEREGLENDLAEGKLFEEDNTTYALHITTVEYDNGKPGYTYEVVDLDTEEEVGSKFGFKPLYFVGSGDEGDQQVFKGQDFNSIKTYGMYQDKVVNKEESLEIYKGLINGEDFYEKFSFDPRDLAEGKLLKEDYDKESLLKALGDADDAFIQLSDGRELIIYNPNSNNDDNVDMWGDYGVFAVSDDGDEEEVLYSDIAGINL